MSLFMPKDPSDVGALVKAYPLCWIVSGEPEQRFATPLPLLPETDSDGNIVSLFGHIALSNPQQKALVEDSSATILCMGPQGYISPCLVADPTWAPTWNYAVCRFETEIRFVPDETDKALSQLALALEGGEADAWTPARMGERYDQLRQRIVAFRAHVRQSHARFKLGQDEKEIVFENIVGGLADRQLADWMKRSRR